MRWITNQLDRSGKRALAVSVIVALIMLSAGCGGSTSSGNSQHGAQNEAGSAAGEHSGHAGSNADEAAVGNDEASGHSGHAEAADEDNADASMTADDVKLEWRYTPDQPKPGEQVKIELFFYDAAGKPVEQFDVNHEKQMHLIIVSNDLSEFNHIHPENKGGGKFEVETAFASGTTYKLFADFIPTGGSQMTATSRVKVTGTKAEQPLEQDAVLTKTVDGLAVSLTVSTFKAGEEAVLTFTFSDAETKEPIADLQPYLGAIGHVVILNEDLNRYLHVHPADDNGSGPTANFMTSFSEPGQYKIWGQFQRADKTVIIPFTVAIE